MGLFLRLFFRASGGVRLVERLHIFRGRDLFALDSQSRPSDFPCLRL